MNSSFEQLFKKSHNRKADNLKYGNNGMPTIKKQQQTNTSSKNKNTATYNQLKYHFQSYNSSVISNNSLQKNMIKANTIKSNLKKSKNEETSKQRNQAANPFKKNLTIQLTKKQKQIREAIEYRFQKSKIRHYKFCCIQLKKDQIEDAKVRQIIDLEEEQNFAHKYGYLSAIKVVNLYEYNRFKEIAQPKKQRSNQKIIVIKNSKKKRQNSDTVISFNNKNNDQSINNHRLILNTNAGNYFSANPINIQSQRNHTQISSGHNRNKSQSPSQNFRLQFPSSKIYEKQKNQSKQKLKNQNSSGLNHKMNFSSSVQKNFKSIKDIYLNAITNLANKNTMKSNNKLFKSQNQIKNKQSKSFIYESDKKCYKKQPKNCFMNQISNKNAQSQVKKERLNSKIYQNSKLSQNSKTNDDLKMKNNSHSALHQNYFSCISSRQNRNDEKNNPVCNNRKPTKQKLDKTVLINQANPSQWKSIIMKIEEPHRVTNKKQLLKEAAEYQNDSKRLKLKKKQQQFNSKPNKNFLSSAQGRFTGLPHSYRQNIKSPKFKRFILNQDEFNGPSELNQGKRHVSSVKNLSNQSFQTFKNSSKITVSNQGADFGKRQKK